MYVVFIFKVINLSLLTLTQLIEEELSCPLHPSTIALFFKFG